MPTYQYYCTQCDETVERNVGVESRNDQQCFRCKHDLTRQVTAPAGIHIK